MKITLDVLQKRKNTQKITAITVYDALFGRIFDGEVDVILVGDSLNMSFGGNADTTNISLEAMIYHTQAVCRGVKSSFIIADMPFGSYAYTKQALKNAIKMIKATHIDAIKIEVKPDKIDIVKALVDEGIAIMAHIGLMPQFIKAEGGYKIKGKTATQADFLLDSALAFEKAGAFGILLEGIQADVAKTITQSLEIPTIGIGSGRHCDGQILVWSDAFGFFTQFKPKFVRRYFEGEALLKQAVRQYAKDVTESTFPNENESY